MRTVAYCGDHTALTTTKFGNKIYVDTRDTSLAPHIMLEGDWEPWVTNAIGTVLAKYPGATFIDVGANVGWYTLLACKVGASRVFAFEPNPRMCELLRKSISVNGYKERVTLTEAACGDSNGEKHFEVDHTEAGGGRITGFATGGLTMYTRIPASLDVPVVRLDKVVLGSLPRSGSPLPQIVMKIDVEGFEPEVLQGATNLTKYSPIMFLEHNRLATHEAMYARLAHEGFELRFAQHSGHLSEPLTIGQIMAIENAETIAASAPGVL